MAEAGAQPGPDALHALVARYLEAYVRHDAAGCAAEFTEDARLDHPFGMAATGRGEIAALHADWFAEDERDKRMWVVEAGSQGAFAHAVIGWSAVTGPPDATPPRTSSGVSLVLLGEDGGALRIHRMALVPDAG